MSFSQFVVILRARWRLGLLVIFCTVALVLAISGLLLAFAPQYTSTAAVVVDNKAVDPINGVLQVAPGSLLSSFMATQVDVAQSERVVLRAARAMKMTESPALRAKWSADTDGRGTFETWLAEKISKKYVVRPSRESNAMTLSYTATDPAVSAEMTNALMKAYIDTTLELRVEPARQYNAFFDERARQMREALEQAQRKLSAYQRDNELLQTEERLDVENARLTELNTQVVAMQNASAEAGGRQAEASANPERMQEVLNNPTVVTLNAELARQSARLQELKSRLGDNHPQVIEAQSSIADVRGRLAAATRLATGSVTASSNVVRGRLEQAKQALEQQRAKVLRLKAKRDEAAVLQRDVENAQRAYDGVLARVSQTDLESQNRQTNVSVLQRATPSAFPSSPKLLLNSAVALVLGALLAIAAIVLRESSDRRLRTAEDVLTGLNQPLLMMLPRSGAASRRNDSRLLQMKARVLNGLPRPASR